MAKTVEAVFEGGVFRPLEPVEMEEGQRVEVSIAPTRRSREEAEAILRQRHKVYEGLSDEDIANIERIALDRSNFFSGRVP